MSPRGTFDFEAAARAMRFDREFREAGESARASVIEGFQAIVGEGVPDVSELTVAKIRELRRRVSEGATYILGIDPPDLASIRTSPRVVDVLLTEIDRLDLERRIETANRIEVEFWPLVESDGTVLAAGCGAARETREYPAPLRVTWRQKPAKSGADASDAGLETTVSD